MSAHPISRRRLLQGGVAATLLTALPSCRRSAAARSADPSAPAVASGTPPANIAVTHDGYGVHVGPTVAANPRDPMRLLAACGASPTPDPEFVATYRSLDGGATWQDGGRRPTPATGPAGDDVTLAYGLNGHGYVCAARAGHSDRVDPANPDAARAVYVWRTEDGGRSFAAPVALVEGVYCDHPYIAADPDPASGTRNVYVAWGAGASHTALDFSRSVDGGRTFASPRRILAEAAVPSMVSAGPELATGPNGLVVAVCEWTSQPNAAGDMIGQVVAVCSTDAGRTFGAPVHLGEEAAAIALPGDVVPNSMPTVACSPRGDAVHAAFVTRAAGAAHSDIVVRSSSDRGRTWSEAVTATPADARIYFQPNLAVDASGRVALSAFALADGRVDRVVMFSPAGPPRFGAPRRVTTASFDPRNGMPTGGKHGAWYIGDYQGITATAGAFALVWNDTRSGKLDLYAATVRP